MRHPCYAGVGLLLLGTLACRRHAAESSVERSASGASISPTLSAVSPDTLHMREGPPAELTVRGSGFVDDSNTVHVGPVTLLGVRSSGNGSVLRFTVPDRVQSGGEAPPSLWISNSYAVVVENARGRSLPLHVFIREHR